MWQRDLDKEMWTAQFKYSCRKTQLVAAQDRTGWIQAVCSRPGSSRILVDSLSKKINLARPRKKIQASQKFILQVK